MPGKEHHIKKMADLLRAGATMLPEHCPLCGSPLFKLKTGEVVCPVHGRIHIVRSDEEAEKVSMKAVLSELSRAIVAKLRRLGNHVEEGDEDTAKEIVAWLDALERIERLLSSEKS